MMTIIDGAADMGAGLYVDGGAALAISDVIIAENIAASAGGAIFVSTDASADASTPPWPCPATTPAPEATNIMAICASEVRIPD